MDGLFCFVQFVLNKAIRCEDDDLLLKREINQSELRTLKELVKLKITSANKFVIKITLQFST